MDQRSEESQNELSPEQLVDMSTKAQQVKKYNTAIGVTVVLLLLLLIVYLIYKWTVRPTEGACGRPDKDVF